MKKRRKRIINNISFTVFAFLVTFLILYYLNLHYDFFSFFTDFFIKPQQNDTSIEKQPIQNIPSGGTAGETESPREDELKDVPMPLPLEDEDSGYSNISTVYAPQQNKTITIASWELYLLDDTNASDDELMQTYASIIDDYDIVFVQGITSSNAFTKLCSLLPSYNCMASSMSGRNASKEQYGVLYRKANVSVIGWKDYNPDVFDRWEHPPLEVLFSISEYLFKVYNIHTNQLDVQKELNYLESIVSESGNMIILGDLNADCSYYNPSAEKEFDDWNWIITDTRDTLVSQTTDCAYDRIILNGEAYSEFAPYEMLGGGVYTLGITETLSSHYLVWAETRPEEQS